MTYLSPEAACSKTSNRGSRSSGNDGINRSPRPSKCSVLDDVTGIRLCSQSTSVQVNARCSDGHRKPTKRLKANSKRHSASGGVRTGVQHQPALDPRRAVSAGGRPKHSQRSYAIWLLAAVSDCPKSPEPCHRQSARRPPTETRSAYVRHH